MPRPRAFLRITGRVETHNGAYWDKATVSADQTIDITPTDGPLLIEHEVETFLDTLSL